MILQTLDSILCSILKFLFEFDVKFKRFATRDSHCIIVRLFHLDL